MINALSSIKIPGALNSKSGIGSALDYNTHNYVSSEITPDAILSLDMTPSNAMKDQKMQEYLKEN